MVLAFFIIIILQGDLFRPRAHTLFSLSIFLGRNFPFDQEIEHVDLAEPEHEVDPNVMAKVKLLFLLNLTVNTTEDDISAAFKEAGAFEEAGDGQIELVRKFLKKSRT